MLRGFESHPSQTAQTTMKKLLFLTALFCLLGLFFNTVEGHTQTTNDDNYICDLPPVDYALISCVMSWDSSQTWEDSYTAKNEFEICWCVCIEGTPICDCIEPYRTSNEEWTWYLIYNNKYSQEEV